MSYAYASDTLTILGLSAATGALGGLAWDIGYSISGRKPSQGLENRLTLPRFVKRGGRTSLELGFFGPLMLGAIAAIVVIFTVGRSGPDGAALLAQVAAVQDGKKVDAESLSAVVSGEIIIGLGVLSGFSAWGILQALSARLVAVAERSAEAAKAKLIASVSEDLEQRGADATNNAAVLRMLATTDVSTAPTDAGS